MSVLNSGYSYALSAIKVFSAWNTCTGSANVSVGVIDSGIFNHSDLIKNKRTGWDFIHDKPERGVDNLGHGTRVAGIIGGSQNKKGIAGVCHHVRLMSLQVLDDRGQFDAAAVIRAISYAAENNIQILNYCNSSDIYDSNLEAAIRQYPGLFICSAGNTGRNIDKAPRYPPSLKLKNMICTAACNQLDELCPSSNYGVHTVDIAAPGHTIYTTAPGRHPDDSYAYICGTSAAAPYVTGVAALMKGACPHASTYDIKQAILKGSDLLPGLYNKVSSGGRLNAYKSVSLLCDRQRPDGQDLLMQRA